MTPHSAHVEQAWNGPKLQVIVRFANAQHDLTLTVGPDARLVPVASLRPLIRALLPQNLAKCRLRLIRAGKLLRDADALSTCLGRESEPWDDPPESDEINDLKHDRRVYVQCSIGDSLSDEEIAHEATDARVLSQRLEETHRQIGLLDNANSGIEDSGTRSVDESGSTTFKGRIRPQGFDRLLSQGFSQEDIVSLRATFLSTLAQSRTASQLPTGDDLHLLEDRWLDSTAFDNDNFEHDEGIVGSMDDLLIGFVIGFFWPVAGLWALHESGMWSERRQSAVWIGVVANIVLGFIRYITFKMEGT